VKDLVVGTRIIGGRAVAPLAVFVKVADERIDRLWRRPNLKAEAIATARAARRPRKHLASSAAE
jgi:hypothetical protein